MRPDTISRAYLDRLRERPLEAGATTEVPQDPRGTVPTPAERQPRPDFDRWAASCGAHGVPTAKRAAPLLRGYVNLQEAASVPSRISEKPHAAAQPKSAGKVAPIRARQRAAGARRDSRAAAPRGGCTTAMSCRTRASPFAWSVPPDAPVVAVLGGISAHRIVSGAEGLVAGARGPRARHRHEPHTACSASTIWAAGAAARRRKPAASFRR